MPFQAVFCAAINFPSRCIPVIRLRVVVPRLLVVLGIHRGTTNTTRVNIQICPDFGFLVGPLQHNITWRWAANAYCVRHIEYILVRRHRLHKSVKNSQRIALPTCTIRRVQFVLQVAVALSCAAQQIALADA